ncbi:putative membrane protein YfkQ [Paenibacillus glycanilyticus]|uniref:Membrane protein YfkQ n=1 Tax=Paenibacillus glycanilyticus TaxID=126569 RepID=A0ABQ6NTM6_9BACL|nr:spore germination protein [Paenibacillus glycanilyticus]GMK47477.1 putative membrane protein YfkQ [Paenibacillus glycanilyticus]
MSWRKLNSVKQAQRHHTLSAEQEVKKFYRDINENEKIFKAMFQDCSDIVFRELAINGQTKILMIYVDGMIDTESFESNVLRPLIYEGVPQGLGTIDSIAYMCEQKLFSIMQISRLFDFDATVESILKGSVAILADGDATACLANIKQIETRSIEESSSEPTLRGPKESFTENLRTNTTMIRRIITSPKLKMKSVTIGTLTKTDVVISYIEDVVEPKLLEEVCFRVSQIDTNGILESGYIEEAIEDTHLTPFPQMLNSERPDVIASGLLEGKVAILTDGTPFALSVPMTFWTGLQAPDDYYERSMYVFMTRILRFIFIVFGVTTSALYIALTNYHQEMVPTKLMISIASLREHAPFPTIIEVFMMEVVFEGLREAGIRLPKTIGPLISIVGALVIGEAAVRAGIISAPIVIVVSFAGIASFIVPRYRFGFPLRILRFPLIILSGMFGLFGLAAGMIAILSHLTRLSPFGIPYLTPVAPLVNGWLKDWVARYPRKLTKSKSE